MSQDSSSQDSYPGQAKPNEDAFPPVHVPPAGGADYVDPSSGAASQPGGNAGVPTIVMDDSDASIGDIGADTATLDAARQTSAAPGGNQPGDEKDEDETDGDDEAQSADASTKSASKSSAKK